MCCSDFYELCRGIWLDGSNGNYNLGLRQKKDHLQLLWVFAGISYLT